MNILILLQLFLEFAITGLFSIGGGLATLPFLQDMGERTGWFSSDLLADMIAVSESTPGAMGLNMASYVGYNVQGVLGGIVATLGLVFPSVVIILIIARILQKFRSNRFVQSTFMGLRPASTALIAVAWLNIFIIAFNIPSFSQISLEFLQSYFSLKIIISVVMALAVFILMKKTKFHPVLFIGISALFGIIFKL